MTTIVGVDDIRFWADNKIVDAVDWEGMRRADAVSVTFRRQKNRDNGVVVTLHRTEKTGEAEMCPVWALAALVIRIRGYASVRTQGTKNVGINALASEHDGCCQAILYHHLARTTHSFTTNTIWWAIGMIHRPRRMSSYTVPLTRCRVLLYLMDSTSRATVSVSQLVVLLIMNCSIQMVLNGQQFQPSINILK
jgi:hypothetical protein